MGGGKNRRLRLPKRLNLGSIFLDGTGGYIWSFLFFFLAKEVILVAAHVLDLLLE